VDKLAPLAEKYGAIMMVDDAHACGVLGRNGRGSVGSLWACTGGGRAGRDAFKKPSAHWAGMCRQTAT